MTNLAKYWRWNQNGDQCYLFRYEDDDDRVQVFFGVLFVCKWGRRGLKTNYFSRSLRDSINTDVDPMG